MFGHHPLFAFVDHGASGAGGIGGGPASARERGRQHRRRPHRSRRARARPAAAEAPARAADPDPHRFRWWHSRVRGLARRVRFWGGSRIRRRVRGRAAAGAFSVLAGASLLRRKGRMVPSEPFGGNWLVCRSCRSCAVVLCVICRSQCAGCLRRVWAVPSTKANIRSIAPFCRGSEAGLCVSTCG